MSLSSLIILNGTHKIYQRLIRQIPHHVTERIEVRSIRANSLIREGNLVMEIMVKTRKYSTNIAAQISEKDFDWAPHPDLIDKNEIVAIREMLSQFKEGEFQFGNSVADRKLSLRATCDSFFREAYR